MMQQRIVKHDLHVRNQIEEGVWFWSRKQYFFFHNSYTSHNAELNTCTVSNIDWYTVYVMNGFREKAEVSTLGALSLCQMHQLPKQKGGDSEAEK